MRITQRSCIRARIYTLHTHTQLLCSHIQNVPLSFNARVTDTPEAIDSVRDLRASQRAASLCWLAMLLATFILQHLHILPHLRQCNADDAFQVQI